MKNLPIKLSSVVYNLSYEERYVQVSLDMFAYQRRQQTYWLQGLSLLSAHFTFAPPQEIPKKSRDIFGSNLGGAKTGKLRHTVLEISGEKRSKFLGKLSKLRWDNLEIQDVDVIGGANWEKLSVEF